MSSDVVRNTKEFVCMVSSGVIRFISTSVVASCRYPTVPGKCVYGVLVVFKSILDLVF